ncbi:MAG TPA: quinohemoprotein amine dehydrogenase maturation protein [Steroidobacteraceae bacterium]|nr:quinohemoprotein amine dehydrogenase maturation protein [Steroidobacteraceae bacterium]
MQFNHANGHVVHVDGRSMLFHVPTSALFELDELGSTLVDLAQREPGADVGTLTQRLETHAPGRFAADQVAGFLKQLTNLEVLQRGDGLRPVNPARVKVESYPLSTIVLNVNTGCNLGCTYCYKEDLAVPSRGERMDFETAARSVDLLLKQAAARSKVGIVFFGGEPLTNVALIRQVVDYAEDRARQESKHVDFSLTTNATLLTSDLIEYFDAHRFGISVSMDGPKALHDRNRRTVGGRGTYEVVARKVRLLLERYRSKPVGARVTLTSGTTEVEAIHEHLRGELGFHEVGYAPVTAADSAGHALSEAELAAVHAGFERLGEDYLKAALVGRNTGFANLHQLMTDLHEGRRKSLPCGAGVGLLAVDRKGDLNLCHRFTGSALPTFGNVGSGIDRQRLGEFLGRASDRGGTDCSTCHIRNLCAGGCYHESWVRYGDPHHRTYHYCDLLRRWVDFGIRVYAEIAARNPHFFNAHIEPRRAVA